MTKRAKKQAKQLADGHAVELWQLDRMIAQFNRNAEAASVGGTFLFD
jgi:hypothetical protein